MTRQQRRQQIDEIALKVCFVTYFRQGEGPLLDDIAARCKRTRATAWKAVQRLEAQGLIKRDRYRHRSIRPTRKAVLYLKAQV